MTSAHYVLGMPQMSLGQLSENWLMREIGDLHWMHLCRALSCKSSELDSQLGERLYATFIRFRLQFSGGIMAFCENDDLKLDLKMERFGKSTMMSQSNAATKSTAAKFFVASTFSVRSAEGENQLKKSQPASEYDESITPLDTRPDFLTEYSNVRRNFYNQQLKEPSNAEAVRINPFTESNGADLFYFASYQAVCDQLWLMYFEKQTHGKKVDYLRYSTVMRDISYFRNLELNESVLLQPHVIEVSADDISMSATLHRSSDGLPIAFVETKKTMRT